MVEAYRLLVKHMMDEFKECYPLHLGVTEAGEGEDGRIKSAIGIGTLLEDGIGDTIRVSLTEDPEFEIPVCREIISRYENRTGQSSVAQVDKLPYNPILIPMRLRHAGSIFSPIVPIISSRTIRSRGVGVAESVFIFGRTIIRTA